MFGNHGLGGLPEEGAHGKSPKCLGGTLGDFGEFYKGFIKRIITMKGIGVHNAIRLNFLYLIQPQTFYCLNKFLKAWAGRNLSNAPALSKCRLKGFQTAFALQTA